jgi:uncharacterized protein (DUF488 family)
MPPTIWTIGHSNRSASEFIDILRAHEVEHVVDVRRFPGSRRLPQFSSDALERELRVAGISYQWLSQLGGRRRADPTSLNTAWRHPSFRAYADHVASEEFADGLMELLMVANGVRSCIMCAEVLWWRCHRRLIADVLVSIGVPVVHFRDRAFTEKHRIAPPARIVGGRLTYAEG